MSALIDFHSHILPGVDDGSRSLRESLDMLRMEADQGIRTVVATPHFYPQHDTPERFLSRRREAYCRLREEAEKEGNLPEILLGAEVYYFSGISHSDIITQLTIAGKNCILLEMPLPPWTDKMYREMEEISTKYGITPLIAHVDRYIGPLRTHRIPERLSQLPVLVQANASFFLRPGTRRMALRMLQEGRIHLLGSDCHNMTSRKPNLDAAENCIRQHLGDDALEEIRLYQEDILHNRL